MNEVLKVIRRRRSVRQFRKKQINDAELTAIMEAGLQAPSGHNDQSCYFLAIQKRELLREISDGSKREMSRSPVDWIANLGRNKKYDIFYNAPTGLIVTARRDAISPLADVCAAMENMLIAAESLDIGSCWMGFVKYYFKDEQKGRTIGVPEGYEVYYGIALGYKPKALQATPPPRKFQTYYSIIR